MGRNATLKPLTFSFPGVALFVLGDRYNGATASTGVVVENACVTGCTRFVTWTIWFGVSRPMRWKH